MEVTTEAEAVDWQKLQDSNLLTPDTICEIWDRVSMDLVIWNTKSATATPPDPPEGGTNRLVVFDTALCDLLVLQPLAKLLNSSHAAPPLQNTTLCGRVFNVGDPTYNCRDCSLDPTCVLCTSCFRQSVHVNHRYMMALSTGSGGYCDCGDVEAWKVEPHCRQHRPPSVNPPLRDEIPSDPPGQDDNLDCMFFSALLKFMVLAFESADSDDPTASHPETEAPSSENHVVTLYNVSLDILSDRVADFVSSSTDSLLDDVKQAVVFLRSVGLMPVFCGDLTLCKRILSRMFPAGRTASALLTQLDRRVISCRTLARHLLVMRLMPFFRGLLEREARRRPAFGRAVSELSIGGRTACCLRRLIELDGRIWKTARQECQLLIIHGLLMEAASRLHFAEVFVECYASVVDASLHHSGTIHDLSVQVLTVPSVAHHLIANCDALAAVLAPLIRECVEHQVEGTISLSGHLSNSAPQRQLLDQFSCINDVVYMMNSPPSRWYPQLTAGFKSAVSSFIQLLSIFEGMSPLSRVTTEHVLYEPSCELEMAVLSSLVPITKLFVSWCVTDLALLTDTYRLVSEKLRAHNEPVGFAIQPANLFTFGMEVSSCRAANVPVSLILPLSRFLVALRLAAETLDITDEEREQLFGCHMDARLLMENPLRALVLNEQVFSGQWRRNGQTVEILCNWYCHMALCADLRDKDLQILQMCAAALDSDVFISSLMFRFGVDIYISQSQNSDQHQDDAISDVQANVAHFLLVLIHVLSERYHVSVGQVTPYQCLRKEVTQWLAMSSMSRSKLTKLLGDIDESLLEEVLSEVADSNHADCVNSHMMYNLKPASYGDYSAIWLHFSRRAHSNAELNMRRLWGETEGVRGLPASLPEVRQWLRPLTCLMTGRVILSLLNHVIVRVISSKEGSQNESLLYRLLYLVAMAILSDQRGQEQGDRDGQRPALSGFRLAAEKAGLTRHLQTLSASGRFSEFSTLISWLLERLQPPRSVSSPLATPGSDSRNQCELERRRKQAAAAERRQRIMRQMATQQRRFMAQQPAAALTPASSEHVQEAPRADDENRRSSGTPQEESSESPTQGSSVCLGLRQSSIRQPIVLDISDRLCILCQSRSSLSANDPSDGIHSRLVVCAFVQESRHLAPRGHLSAPSGATWWQKRGSAALWRLPHASSCGHVMHADCWLRHLRVVTRDRRRTVRPMGVFDADWRLGEYLCPLCQRLSNTVLPLLQPSQLNTSQTQSLTDTRVTPTGFEPWLETLQVNHEDASGSSGQPNLLPARTSAAENERGLGTFVNLSRIDVVIMNEFCRTCHTIDGLTGLSRGSISIDRASRSVIDHALLAVISADTDVDMLSLSTPGVESASADTNDRSEATEEAQLCCAYTIHCLERQLSADNAPLMSANDLRTVACLSTLTQLLTCLGAQKAVTVESRSHLRLLAGGPGALQPCGTGAPHPALRQDPFCALVRALPAFVSKLDVAQADHVQALVPSGSLQEQHTLRICVVLCLAQAFLSYQSPERSNTSQFTTSHLSHAHAPPTDQSASPSDSMDVEWAEPEIGWPISDAERDWLFVFGQMTRESAGLEPIMNCWPQVMRHVAGLLLPFLRCCALLFRYISNVPPPLSLLQHCPDSGKHLDHLMLYLDLQLSSISLQSAKHLVTRWCEQLRHASASDSAETCEPINPRSSPFSESHWRLVFSTANRTPSLVKLPREFSDLVIQASCWPCGCDQSLGPSSRSPTLCLLCGLALCSEALCTSAGGQRRGMDGHTIVCGGTAAAFLVVRRCKFYLTYSSSAAFRRAVYPSPYVDRYGESDEGLRRGVPLSLHPLRYSRLQQLVFSHGVVEQVCRYVEEHSAMIPLLT